MKQYFRTKSFSLPSLSTVEYSSAHLLFISYSTMIENACINTQKSIWEKLQTKNTMNKACIISIIIAKNIYCMLITRLICTQWKCMTTNQFIASPSKFSLKYSLSPKWSMLSNNRIRGPTHSKKAWHLSHQSFLSFLHKIKYGAVTLCDSYPQFPWSLLGMPGLVGHYDFPFGIHTRKKSKQD